MDQKNIGKTMTLTVIVLTKNEENHIARCLDSVKMFADHCVVVDSGSNDKTKTIAKSKGAEVLHKEWVNYATQFNWAIGRVPDGTKWILRLDADEVVSSELAREIAEKLSGVASSIDGIFVSRRMKFLGRPIRHGGVFPIRVLRLFRPGRGRCENRWMDEHILVQGPTTNFVGEILDDNRKSLTWWTHKHNAYASREVVDLLNLEYGFMPHETVADLSRGQQAGAKRWFKEKVYTRLPSGLRVFAYFLYRYVLRLGFLDGRSGAAFHVLQGFWYRYLVDMKIYEVKSHMLEHGVDVITGIKNVLEIDIKQRK